MHRLVYVASRGERVDMDCDGLAVGAGVGLRGTEWSYTLGASSVSGVSRRAREVEVEAWVSDESCRAVFERDMATASPGTLSLDGGWEQRALVASSKVTAAYLGEATLKLDVLLLDGAWHREHVASFSPDVTAGDDDGWLDLPTDAPYDLGGRMRQSYVETGLALPAPVRMTVYGLATNPSVTIGPNRYAFDVTVPAGGILVADGTGARKTITVRSRNGDVRDAFDTGHRGAGEGAGEYCFQPLAPGVLALSWDGSFGFDLAWWETTGGLPWTS